MDLGAAADIAVVVGTHAAAFLAGAATGAAASFYGTKWTDRRRDRERTAAALERFRATEAKMPGLFAEMREDLRHEGARVTREVVVPAFKGLAVEWDGPHFRYYHEDHRNLKGQLDILVNLSYMTVKVSDPDLAVYTLSEGFVDLLLHAK